MTLAEALDDRASFRRFCGFAAHEPTLERTAFVRFRRELVRRALDRVLFDAVTRELEVKEVMVRTSTLVDALQPIDHGDEDVLDASVAEVVHALPHMLAGPVADLRALGDRSDRLPPSAAR